ncbi:MAG: hypothetical protein ACR2MT_18180 [Aurantibacter sp.]
MASLFDFNKEANIPTFYSAVSLLVCAFLLLYIYWMANRGKNKKHKPYWLLFSLIFAFLAIDEIASIHEVLTVIIRNSYSFSGFLYYAWVIPYVMGTVLLGFIIIPFLSSLPKNIRSLFITAGLVFLSGAVGMELIGGMQDELYGKLNLEYMIYYTLEEFLEMLGTAIFIYALLTHIANSEEGAILKVKFETSPDNAAAMEKEVEPIYKIGSNTNK